MSDLPWFSQRLQRLEGLRCRHCGKQLYAYLTVYCDEEGKQAGSRSGVHMTCVHEPEQRLSIAAEARAMVNFELGQRVMLTQDTSTAPAGATGVVVRVIEHGVYGLSYEVRLDDGQGKPHAAAWPHFYRAGELMAAQESEARGDE